jgi:Zn finger protein HypA/HybF involved in hydrogenase expression
MANSRLVACCKQCGHTADRSEFYRERPDSRPSFVDICPACQSINVDVIDAAASALAARAVA